MLKILREKADKRSDTHNLLSTQSWGPAAWGLQLDTLDWACKKTLVTSDWLKSEEWCGFVLTTLSRKVAWWNIYFKYYIWCGKSSAIMQDKNKPNLDVETNKWQHNTGHAVCHCSHTVLFSCHCVFQGSGVCESSYNSPLSIQLEHQGCWGTRAYRPRFCALTCPEGHCCSPSHTRTVLMVFRCPQGRLIQHQVMMIESCSCSISTCRQSRVTASHGVLSWLWGSCAYSHKKDGQVLSVRKIIKNDQMYTDHNVAGKLSWASVSKLWKYYYRDWKLDIWR